MARLGIMARSMRIPLRHSSTWAPEKLRAMLRSVTASPGRTCDIRLRMSARCRSRCWPSRSGCSVHHHDSPACRSKAPAVLGAWPVEMSPDGTACRAGGDSPFGGEHADDAKPAAAMRVGGRCQPGAAVIVDLDTDVRAGAAVDTDGEGSAGGLRESLWRTALAASSETQRITSSAAGHRSSRLHKSARTWRTCSGRPG